MKSFIPVKIACLAFLLSVCSPRIQQHNISEKIMADGVQTHGNNNSGLAYFSVSINTNDSVRFNEDGNVYVSLANDSEVFDISRLHQQHRLTGLKNLLMSAR